MRGPLPFQLRLLLGRAVFAESAGGAYLVETHEPRVARNVSRDYCRQPTSDPN
jgi:hypothetical protein